MRTEAAPANVEVREISALEAANAAVAVAAVMMSRAQEAHAPATAVASHPPAAASAPVPAPTTAPAAALALAEEAVLGVELRKVAGSLQGEMAVLLGGVPDEQVPEAVQAMATLFE